MSKELRSEQMAKSMFAQMASQTMGIVFQAKRESAEIETQYAQDTDWLRMQLEDAEEQKEILERKVSESEVLITGFDTLKRALEGKVTHLEFRLADAEKENSILEEKIADLKHMLANFDKFVKSKNRNNETENEETLKMSDAATPDKEVSSDSRNN